MVLRNRANEPSTEEFIERLRKLVAAQIAGSNQLLIRFSEFVKDASRTINADLKEGRPDAQALLSRWLEFNLASYSVVTTNSLALLNGLLSAAEHTLVVKPTPASSVASAPPRVELRLFGRHGERASSGFLVENNRSDVPLVVTFECGNLTPEAEPPLPGSHVQFDPGRLEIAPRGQATVTVAVLITRDFKVGQTYTGIIRLLGFEAKELALSLTVLPPDHGNQAIVSSSKRSRSSKKSRARD
jgi:hypothetical protein